MSQPPNIDLNALWKYVTEQTKRHITLPAVWRAMEAAKPLTLEGDELILGFPVEHMHESGLVMDNRYRNIVEQVMEAATRKRLRLHVIQGDSVEDWEAYKQQRVDAARLEAESRGQFQKRAEAGDTWEAVGELLVRKYSGMQHRGLASAQGRYLEEAIGVLTEAYGRLMPEKPSELDERNYSRAVERVAERAGVPGGLVAHMVYVRMPRP